MQGMTVQKSAEVRYINPSLDYSDVWTELYAAPKVQKSMAQYDHENDTDDVIPEYSTGMDEMNKMAQQTLVRGGFDNVRPNPDAWSTNTGSPPR